ncbi:MAG: MlaA family lipoprotein [Candidatus Gastranaerophilales bacterium]|nr:MlaA family lipoprotein [Candidatus Gastranaerophilales bacterium]
MFIKNNKIAVIAIVFCLFTVNQSYVFSLEPNAENIKYPDYTNIYLGKDKFEKFNRKVFNFNLKLNKYAIRPVHILWSSIMPKYGMDRISGITHNIEYPIRLMSTLVQKDFKASKDETIRFFVNTTIGLGGMFDPAKKILELEPVQENMEQALAKCKVKSGCYLVMPFISSTTPRDLLGRLLDTALNPSSYIATPAIAAVKAAIMVNRTYFMQPIVKMVESTYADPYDIARKFYGLENYIKCTNLDRTNLITQWIKNKKTNTGNEEKTNTNVMDVNHNIDEETNLERVLQGNANEIDIILREPSSKKHFLDNIKLTPDIVLSNYNPQTPVIDSMRTALFETEGIKDSFWAEFSIWNRGFYNKLKLSSINIIQGKENYKFKYILQKNKTSPLAVIYPSIGEGIMSSHSATLAKIFYDEGYSVIILGSHFQWEFVKSMPDNFHPGIPTVDAYYVKLLTDKIISSLEEKHHHKFTNKTVMGTSFGALMTLFIAQNEFNPNDEEQHNKYIAVCPPVELMYAMNQIDKNTEEWKQTPETLKEKVALTAAKIIQLAQKQDTVDRNINSLPFSDEEAKLITGFILHQKLSDLIFTLEKAPKDNKSDIYTKLNNMNYSDYAHKYLLSDKTTDELNELASLHHISSYLRNADNYKIYHAMDDYLANVRQLHQLKQYSGTKTVLFNNGAHLGFLYRPEFITSLKKEICLKQNLLSLK